MLTAIQLVTEVRDLIAGHVSIGDFEDWFRDCSRDVHLWGDEQLNALVDAIEGVFSEYHFEGLRGASLNRELATAIGPFERVKHLGDTAPSTVRKTSSVPCSPNRTIALVQEAA